MRQDPQLSAVTQTLAGVHGFRADALGANRSGRLTDDQVRGVTRGHRRSGLLLTLAGVVFVGLGLVAKANPSLAQSEDPSANATLVALGLIGFGAVCLLAAVYSVFRRSTADLAKRRVASTEGFIRVLRHGDWLGSEGEEGPSYTYTYKINGIEFPTSQKGAEAINPQLRYRVYYLPSSKKMVNIEAIGAPVSGTPDALAAPDVPGEGRMAPPYYPDVRLTAEEGGAIVGEPMRFDQQQQSGGEGVAPGMTMATYHNEAGTVRVVISFILGGQDSPVFQFFQSARARMPGAQPVSDLGDEAVYASGQFMVLSPAVRDDARLLDIERRLAEMALPRLG